MRFLKLRRVCFSKGKDFIELKYSYDDQNPERLTILTERPTSRSNTKLTPPPIYNSPLPVSNLKLKDLLKLVNKSVIPEEYKAEYMALKGSVDVPDVLAQTDEEDNVEDELELEEPITPKLSKRKSKQILGGRAKNQK